MKVALFSTCIVDTLKPEIGFAALGLLEAAGCNVQVPEQSCCGQPNFNNGDEAGAAELVKSWYLQFREFDYVIIPSGSCTAMLRHHALSLFKHRSPVFYKQLKVLTGKTYELSQFLSEIIRPQFGDIPLQKICYHDSCSGLRDLGIKHQPRVLLQAIGNLQLNELSNAENCCGFGGTFCVKFPEISCRLADDKIEAIEQSGADILVGGDWGCLMHLQARIDALGKPFTVKHFSEILLEALKQEEVKS